MKKQKLIQKSIEIIIDYYNNQLEPFFDAISDDVLWIGPRGGQMLRGKEAIIAAWSGNQTQLQFTMGNIEAEAVAPGANNLEVLLEYVVYTHFPGGQVDRHRQRLHYSWGYEKVDGEKVPKVFMIHISNITEEEASEKQNPKSRVKVYATTPEESSKDAANPDLPAYSRIHFRTAMGKGPEEVTYFFNSGTILWIESARGSHHSIIHTTEGEYESLENLRYFEKQFGDTLLRIHASFLVNPLYLRNIKRFEVTMTDGAVLPVPEKKYTAVRKQIIGWNGPIGKEG